MSTNPNDELKRDYDRVETLGDLIEAREQRDSAFTQTRDGIEDMDLDDPNVTDAERELSYPHKHGPTEDEQLGLDVDLMDTPHEEDISFDWQDSAEEMLPTDPEPQEGFGEYETISGISTVGPNDLVGPTPSVDYQPETATAGTEEEEEEFATDGGGEREPPPPNPPIPLETAMDSDSDEADFSVQDKFAGELDRDTAIEEFEDIRIYEEQAEQQSKK